MFISQLAAPRCLLILLDKKWIINPIVYYLIIFIHPDYFPSILALQVFIEIERFYR